MTREEKLKKVAELQAKVAEFEALDPFWFYKPADGKITDERKKFLRRYLKEEDVPETTDSQLEVLLSRVEVKGVSGGNRCLGYETLIYDPVKGVEIPVGEIKNNFFVLAFDGSKIVETEALAPFIKPEVEPIYKVVLSHGGWFTASGKHLVLTPYGFCELGKLRIGCEVYLPQSNSGIYPQVHSEDDRHSLNKVPDSRCDYPAYRHSCGGQLHHAQEVGLNASPLQGDVHEHMTYDYQKHWGVQENRLAHNHPYQSSDHQSTQGVLDRNEVQYVGQLCYASCKCVRHADYYNQFVQQSIDGFFHLEPTDEFDPQAKYVCLNDDNHDLHESLDKSPFPIITSIEYLRDDVKYDFTVPKYHNYLAGGAIHHNSGKSNTGTIAGIIKSTGELPDSMLPYKDVFQDVIDRSLKKVVRGRVTAVDDKQLQRVVVPLWKRFVPRDYLKGGNWEDSYSRQYNILTLYRKGKECATVEFLTNAQDVKSSQGGDLDWAVFDEEPDKDKWKETLMRFGTAAKLDIEIDWTPTEGLTWATDIFHAEADNEDLGSDNRKLFKLSSVTNPYVSLDTLSRIMDEYEKVSSYDEMKMRLLGEAISLSGLVYGKFFKDSVHVIEPFTLNKNDHFILRGIDPHLVKPSCCVEIAVDREGNKYVIGAYAKDCDTQDFKKELAERVQENGWRLGWSIFDKSCDSTIKVFGDRNVYLEMTRGENAIPAAFKSEKFTGSINAGVDEIKKSLKVNPRTGKPTLFFFNTPEVKQVIHAIKGLERDTYTNEDAKGMKDRIKEGKWDLHACLRYLHQRPIVWLPPMESVPEVLEERYI